MNLPLPELPNNEPASVPGRCADLTASLRGADPTAVETAITSLAAQLKQLGWQVISDTPGSRFYSKGGRMLALDQLVGMIAGGYMSERHWRATCAADGISDLMVPVPGAAAPAATQPNPQRTFQDPFDVPGASGPPASTFGAPPVAPRGLARKAASVAVAVVVIVGLAILNNQRAQSFNDHLAGHSYTENETEVAYDGALSVDGGRATSSYTKIEHEFEATSPPLADSDFPDAISFEDDGVSTYAGGGRNSINIAHAVQRKSLDDPETLKQWINSRNLSASSRGRLVSGRKTTLAGGVAYEWEWGCDYGCWNYAIRAPRGKDVYSVRCHFMDSEDTLEARARCKQVARGLKISKARS